MPARSRELLDEDIRRLVSSHIESGRLPVVVISSALAGYGSGQTCIVCECPILAEETEFEVELPRAGQVLRFHLRCLDAWQRQCLDRAGRAGAPADGASLGPR